jgi:DNA-directed RNA polymerase subunit RPC12/RpoP
MFKSKNIWFIYGIICCTWYVPFIAILSLVSGIKNNISIDMILIPMLAVIIYISGLVSIYSYIKSDKSEREMYSKEKLVLPPKRMEEPVRLHTKCWNCKMEYPYIKNHRGDTVVQCPSCGNRGLIK